MYIYTINWSHVRSYGYCTLYLHIHVHTELGFCGFETTNTDRGTRHWPETIATEDGMLVSQQCALGEDIPGANASRNCNLTASWENPMEGGCTSVVSSAFDDIANVGVNTNVLLMKLFNHVPDSRCYKCTFFL